MTDEACELVPKLEEESNVQYAAFLLYCESSSLKELWRELSVNKGRNDGRMGAVFERFQAIPTLRTLERWSGQFDWVKRKDKQVGYFLKPMTEEYQERHAEQSRVFARNLFAVVSKIKPIEDRRKYNRFHKPFIRRKDVGTQTPATHQDGTEK